MFHRSKAAFFLAAVIVTAAACSNGTVPPGSSDVANSAVASHAGSGQIQHIVIVMQEARSFDNLFCGYSGANGRCAGSEIPLEAGCTLSDTFADFERDRKTGDFSHERADCPGYHRPEYGHVPAAELKPYYEMAQQYVLGDDMFSSTGNPTFEAHQYLIAAEAGNAKDQPFGKTPPDGCVYRQFVRDFGGGKIDACFAYKTLGDELIAVGLSWRYYRTADPKHPIVNTWDAYGWIKGGSSGISPSSAFIRDVGSGELASVTWVTPAYANSDLSGSLSCGGPNWVASVVNAVGESQFWNTSAVVIVWNGFGGWYDHVPPPALDREGLGFRVPLLIVSPYARSGSVAHTQFETGSILKFVEDTFGLAPLGASDSRARNLAVSTLDLNQQPKLFTPIQRGSGCGVR